MARAEAAGADALAVFTAATDAFTHAQHRDDGRRVARGVRAGPRPRRRPRLVAARLRLDRVRLPVQRRGRPGDGRRGRPAAPRPRRRRGLLRRHDRRRRAGPGRGADRAGGRGRDPAGAHRVPLPRHARHGPRQRRGRPRCRGPLLRRRRPAAPAAARTRPAPPAISPPRTSSTCSTRRATSTASSLEGVLDAARFIAAALGQAARDEGRPGRRLGPGDGAATGRPLIGSSGTNPVSLPSSRAMDGVVLVLNQNYEPLNVCNLPRAFRLVFGEKAEVIEYDHQVIRTPRTEYRAPSVIRLQHQIRRPRPRVKLSRREIFARDRHTCQYCGRADPRPDARPRRAAPPRRRAHVGEPRRRLQGVQPPQGRQDARGGAAAPRAGRRSSRAATSTRCSRRTSPTSATRPGGPTSSSAGTDARPDADAASRRPARLADARADRSDGLLDDALGAPATPAYVVGGSLRDALLGRAGRGLGPRDRRAARRGRSQLFPGAVYENRSGRSRSAAAATVLRDHDVPERPRLRRLPAAAPGRVRRRRSRRTSRGATSPSTRWPGARATADGGATFAGARRPVRRRRRPRGAASCGRSATRATRFEEDALRMLRAVRLAATLGFEVEPATLAAIRATRAARRRTSRASGSRPSCGKLLARRPAVGRAAAAGGDRAPRRRSRRSSPRSAACRRTRSRARTSGTTRCGRSTRRRRPAGRPPGGARSTTSASPRRSPTATSTATTRSAPSWRGELLERLRVAARRDRRVVHLVRHHMFTLRADAGPMRPSGGSSRKVGPRARRRAVRAARGGQHRVSGVAGRRPTASPSSARASRRSSRRRRRSTGRALAIDGDDLMRELGLEPGPQLGRDPRRAARAGDRGPGAQRRADAPAARAARCCAAGRPT